MAQRLGLIVFGATGYTGKVVVEKIVSLPKFKSTLTWGVAGRSRKKLQATLSEISKKTGAALDHVEIINASIDDPKSMRDMAKRCTVLINCVGPYRHFGEQAVRACIETGTHHVDVTGEPEYMERMQLLFHKEAEEKGVYVVSGCGFDSVPADLGAFHFMQQFDGGEAHSVESFFELTTKKPLEGASMNYATWESLVYGMVNAKDLGPIRKKLFPERLPVPSPKLSPRGSVFRNPVGRGWCMPFIGSDLPVMRRSQYFYYQNLGTRPLQIQCYFTIASLSNVLAFVTAGTYLSFLSRFSWGRQLLLDNPEFFTKGVISREGPTEENRKNTDFSMTFVGHGWSEKKPDGKYKTPPDTRVTTRISGNDPAYGFAAICALLCATTILEEADKMPSRGGVYPPGAAFHQTSLLEELQNNGLKVEVLEKRNLLKNKL